MPGPLGIKDDVELTREQRCTLQYIEDFDLEEPVNAAVEAGSLDEGERRSAERELKRFFALAYLEEVEGAGLAPAAKVDAVWHQFILDTRNYMRFSHRVFGRFMHHVPGERRRPKRLEAARPKVRRHFEDVDEALWKGDAYICWFPYRPRD